MVTNSGETNVSDRDEQGHTKTTVACRVHVEVASVGEAKYRHKGKILKCKAVFFLVRRVFER